MTSMQLIYYKVSIRPRRKCFLKPSSFGPSACNNKHLMFILYVLLINVYLYCASVCCLIPYLHPTHLAVCCATSDYGSANRERTLPYKKTSVCYHSMHTCRLKRRVRLQVCSQQTCINVEPILHKFQMDSGSIFVGDIWLTTVNTTFTRPTPAHIMYKYQYITCFNIIQRAMETLPQVHLEVL